ncbi:hypothetical protein [Methylobacterium sp. WSM2598]|uniref:hypothetical protein n=1 Tax=Methylobacterium sp. WSM2598 TaxID=398261 RepID=UPI00036AD8F2|nr:hypothetical protein [Methylobacterium sp. WSM2598]
MARPDTFVPWAVEVEHARRAGLMSPTGIAIRPERCGTVLRAVRGDRCLALAEARQRYGRPASWSVRLSTGEAYGTAETAIAARIMLREAAAAQEARDAAARG